VKAVQLPRVTLMYGTQLLLVLFAAAVTAECCLPVTVPMLRFAVSLDV
jgi:hypothetical protein